MIKNIKNNLDSLTPQELLNTYSLKGYVYVFSITAATANTVMLIAITIACRKTSDYPQQQKRPLKMTFLFGKCSACLPP
jgi:hypothetical protein